MLTWKLWRALNREPVRSPLYRRVYRLQHSQDVLEPLRIPLFGWFRNAGLIALPILLILIGVPLLLPVYYLSLLLAPVLLPLANTIYGMTLAINVGGGIVKERERRTYDVLCTVPEGALGMHWSYCTGWIHAHVGYRYAMLGVLATGIVATLVGLSPNMIFRAGQVDPVVVTARGLALGILFVVDYAQSIILGSLLSLLVPLYADTETNARLWSSSLLIALQLAVYLPTLLLAVYALPNTFQVLRLSPQVGDLLLPFLLVGFFITLRALIINGMWRAVERQLSATAMELDAVMQAQV